MKKQKEEAKLVPEHKEKPAVNRFPRTVLHTSDLSEVTKAIEDLTANIKEGDDFTDPEFKAQVNSIFTAVDEKNIHADM